MRIMVLTRRLLVTKAIGLRQRQPTRDSDGGEEKVSATTPFDVIESADDL